MKTSRSNGAAANGHAKTRRHFGHMTEGEHEGLLEILRDPLATTEERRRAEIRLAAAQKPLPDGYIAVLDVEAAEDEEKRSRKKADDYSQGLPREEDFSDLRPWPAAPEPAAFRGLAGEVVRTIDPHTEADPNAVLAHFLVGFGNLLGRGPHWFAGPTRHSLNLFMLLIGGTSSGRKGTALDSVTPILRAIDPSWKGKWGGGLISGQGLIHQIRDPIVEKVKRKAPGQKNLPGVEEEEVIDAGQPDKRLLVIEEEFSSVLAAFEMKGCTLNQFLRAAWDSKPLRTRPRTGALNCEEPHVSIIAHNTPDELRVKLSKTDRTNGFANRMMWLCSRRSKSLPSGGRAHEIDWTPLAKRLKQCVNFATLAPWAPDGMKMERSEEAEKLWAKHYDRLMSGPPGPCSTILNRGAPQAMRLACIYAILDLSPTVELRHLESALALWGYSERCAEHIFGDGGEVSPKLKQLRAALEHAKGEGLTLTFIRRRILGDGKTATRQLREIVDYLQQRGEAQIRPGKFPAQKLLVGSRWLKDS